MSYVKHPIVVLPLLLFFLVSAAEASFLYDGKSSDVFEAETTKIKNQKILETVVQKVKKDKEINQLLITVVSPETKKKDSSSSPGQLGEKRFEVLKAYFTKKLPGVEVMGGGSTIPVKEGTKAHPLQDILKIQAGYKPNIGKPGETSPEPEYPESEEWKRELRERYRKVEEEHRYLCEIPFKRIESGEKNCDISSQTNKEFYLCIMIGHIYTYTDRRHVSVRGSKYDYERIRVLEETGEEVYRIAKEIEQKDPKAGPVKYNGRFIADEVKHSLLEVKYYMKALKIVEKGIKHLTEFSGEDNKVKPIGIAYQTWWTNNVGYGSHYYSVTRRKNIDHIRELHNYVRKNLKLQIAEDNEMFPICVETTRLHNKALNPTFLKEQYHSLVLPGLRKNGIKDFPLSDSID